MKLKTEFQDEDFRKGEVADVSIATMPDGRIVAKAKAKSGGKHTFYYDCIETLCNDWSDYEEPKEFWFVNDVGEVEAIEEDDSEETENAKQIGNYFETKEKAEKAVEKLKAWTRLKDKGFNIYSWDYEFDMVDKPAQTIILRASAVDNSNKDLDLLFGGEE